MIETSLDRLKKDHTELQYFLKRLERDGDTKRIPFVQTKLRYIVNMITEMEDDSCLRSAAA
jgi:hypothetical protein